jgi:phosphate transport system substrate-binding protein
LGKNQTFFDNFFKMLMKKILFLVALASFANQAFANESNKRPYIQIVGSSTISPLMAAVSEEFANKEAHKNLEITTPLVESTGTGGGFKLFCAGVGAKHPDFVNASRPIEEEELELCAKNGVNNPIEIKIGYDGIVLARSKAAPPIKLSQEHIFLALAEKVFDEKSRKLVANPYQNWSDIDNKLPKVKILVYGPPLTSGTRDVFADMVMEGSCFNNAKFVEAIKDNQERKKQCHKLRNDGHFIELAENDNSVASNIKNNRNAFGIIGFAFLQANQKIIKATSIDGVLPTQENITSKKYPLSRPLFVYFKKEHLNLVPHLPQFINEIVDPETIGSSGYLVRSGLVAMDKKELKEVTKTVSSKLK